MEKHAHESGLLGIVDVCAGCQAAREGACSVGKEKRLPWGRGKILVQKEEQEDRKGVLCGGKWE